MEEYDMLLMGSGAVKFGARNVSPPADLIQGVMESGRDMPCLFLGEIKEFHREYRWKATKVYDYPSLREFAGYLQTELNVPTSSVPSLPLGNALRDLLRQVQQGLIDIDAADHQLAEFSLS